MSVLKIDERLIVQMGTGDARALERLYSLTADVVFGFALSIVGNRMDAEDVMHDAFIRAYQASVAYQPQGKPLAWLLTIVRNLSYNTVRQRKPTVDVQEIEPSIRMDQNSDPLAHMMLREAMEVLDTQERQVVILHALTGLKHREIAGIMQLPLGTVLSKYHRAIAKLKKSVDGERGSR